MPGFIILTMDYYCTSGYKRTNFFEKIRKKKIKSKVSHAG